MFPADAGRSLVAEPERSSLNLSYVAVGVNPPSREALGFIGCEQVCNGPAGLAAKRLGARQRRKQWPQTRIARRQREILTRRAKTDANGRRPMLATSWQGETLRHTARAAAAAIAIADASRQRIQMSWPARGALAAETCGAE